tara:strand:+ start:1778 stop:1951 length:174 start_codon:yes stop_codon:yes gene_type:complete
MSGMFKGAKPIAMSLSPVGMALDKKKKKEKAPASSAKSVIKPRNLLEPNLNASNGVE